MLKRDVAQPNLFFWLLVAGSLLLIGAGLWNLVQAQRTLAAQSQPSQPAGAAEPAPDFNLLAADGSQMRLSDLRGKVVLLNFWATWCPPCRAEMPDLEALYQEYGARQGFVVVGVNVEEPAEPVQAFGQQNRLSFPLLLDPDGHVSSDQYRARSLPTSLVIDRSGLVRDRWIGQLSKSAMINRLKRVW